MVAVMRILLPALLLSLLAGCTGTGLETIPDDNVPEVDATATTGGIRGVIVDNTIKPIKGAAIDLVNHNKTITTEDDGLFVISGLQPGSYLVKASHPLYATAQQNVEVVAGENNPPAVKFQLDRTIFAEPYLQTYAYEGFIFCSVNTVGLLSEECGEGAGVPCEVPAVGCQRVGGQDGNNVQFDVYIESEGLASIIFEKYWEPTSEAGNELYTPIGTNWVCDPTCSWDSLTEYDAELGENVTIEGKGGSPQYARIDAQGINQSKIAPGVTVTMFTWAGSFEDPAGVALSQRYQDYMTLFYYIPAPEGWSFVAGSPNPFT